MGDINIGVLHYKTIDKTIDCISSILKTCPKADIYVIDNLSDDGSLEKLMNLHADIPNIQFIPLNENKGFACANNHFMRSLRAKGEKKAILTNNDIIFRTGSIDQLIKTLDETDAILVVPKVMNPDGETIDSVHPYRDNNIYSYLWHIAKDHLHTKKYADRCSVASPVKTFLGCCLACNLEQMEHIGYMDEHTFLYFEEPILSARIKHTYYKMVFEPTAQVIHTQGATTALLHEMNAGYWLDSQMYYMKHYLRVNKYLLALYTYIVRGLDKRKFRSERLYKQQTKTLEFILESRCHTS